MFVLSQRTFWLSPTFRDARLEQQMGIDVVLLCASKPGCPREEGDSNSKRAGMSRIACEGVSLESDGIPV